MIPEIAKKLIESQDNDKKKQKKKAKEKAEKKRLRAEQKEERTDLLSMLKLFGTILWRMIKLRGNYRPGFFMSFRASMPEALRNRDTGDYETAIRGFIAVFLGLACWLWFIFRVTLWYKWPGIIGFGALWLIRLQHIYAETNLSKAIERADIDATYGTFGM